MEKKNKILKICLIALITIIVIILGIIISDRATVNKKYGINDDNIDIPIFVYHNIVSNNSEVAYDYMQTTKDVFEKQIVGLKNLGYDFISYEQLQKFKNNEIELKKKSCLLTFDDGYKGVYENAYPIAIKYDIPFTVFVITNNMYMDETISWENAKEMQDSGLVTIASHSTNHPEFTSLSVEEAVNDVNRTYEIIEEKLGKQPIKIFTYPYGLHKEEQNDALWKEGYIQNLTDNRINKSKNLDLSRLHRCYPLGDSVFKMVLKIFYRSIRYN